MATYVHIPLLLSASKRPHCDLANKKLCPANKKRLTALADVSLYII